MIYNTNNYSFTQKSIHQDKIPSWMDDNFFNKLQQAENENFMEKTATLNEKKICKCCNTILQEDEVNFCKSCINK